MGGGRAEGPSATGDEGQATCHSLLTLMGHALASLRVCILKVRI